MIVRIINVLEDCPDHCSENGSPRLHVSSTHIIVERHLFRPCYKVHTSPSSKLGDYVGTMHLPVHLVFVCTTIGFLTKLGILFRPWHHVPTSPTTRLGDYTSDDSRTLCFKTTYISF